MNKDKTQALFKKIAYYSGVIVIGVTVGLALQFVQAAFQEPGNMGITFPQNVEPPLNTGASEQTKTGNLKINNAIIGNTFAPSWAVFANKDMANQGVSGYALTQNTTGNYTLINKLNTNDGYIGFRVGNNNKMVILNNGNVGIGATNPTATLQVDGQIRITGGNPGTGKVLTTDSNGLASWQAPSGGGNCRLEVYTVGGMWGTCPAGWQFIGSNNQGSNGAYCWPSPTGVALSNSNARGCGDSDVTTCGRVVCN